MARTEFGTATGGESLVNLPQTPIGYVAIALALVTGIVHLTLAPQVVGFSQTLATLFALNGIGFLVGLLVYLSRFWRRELFLVAAVYSLLTLVAFFVWPPGSEIEFLAAFYRGPELNVMAVVAKTAETLLAVCTAYLYVAD
ncbi:hypothetical protein ACFQJD_11715 [Haloplanus sp. GCM10025708]|uniref:DUF7475 family protein n=1 Tax=Haloferacaceae TaxID=1644056 RepID=UPI003613485B